MCSQPQKVPEPLPAFAPQWLAQRRLGFKKLDELRRQKLRAMTEVDAARIFSQLDPARPYPLRTSSGLVAQQRWFRLLNAKLETGEARSDQFGPSAT